ncbi:MAG: DUF4287 domain-containing protein [Chthoniobacterales bacterium]
MNHQPDIGEEAVLKATGRSWSEWLALLAGANMAARTHEEILDFLREDHGVPSWWQQVIANEFEQSIGHSSKHESDDGFQVSVSWPIDLPVEKVFEMWADDVKRATWLRRADFTPDTIKPPNVVRGKWMPNGSRVDMEVSDIGDGRCQLTVQHRKLADEAAVERMRELWKRFIERMIAKTSK